MSYGWENGRKHAENATRGMFFKLKKEGDSEIVVFCGEPFTVEHIGYNEMENKYQPFDASLHKKETCRHKINVFLPNAGEMKIWEFSPTVFKQLMAAKEKYGLDKFCFEIKKEKDLGAFSILPEIGKEITPALKGRIDNTKLHDLEVGKKDDSEVPF